MMLLAKAVLAGSAPAMRALEPLVDSGPRKRVGLGWLTTQTEAGAVTW